MDQDTAARLAENIVQDCLKPAVIAEGYLVFRPDLESLQDVIYWLLRSKAVKK